MKVTVVIPCYNEATRLDAAAIADWAQRERTWSLDVLFVDDGSTDDTRTLLKRAAAASPLLKWLSLPHNQGKAEAVRHGLQHAVAAGAAVVAYCDADLATPLDDLEAIIQRLVDDNNVRAVLGSRVRMLGHDISRDARRHYLGRVFATGAALTLGFAVYDTQCGAKAFRVEDTFIQAVAQRFSSRWTFDVELLLRLTKDRGPGGIVEHPLSAWRDVRGSTLGATAMVRAGTELVALAWRQRQQRRG